MSVRTWAANGLVVFVAIAGCATAVGGDPIATESSQTSSAAASPRPFELHVDNLDSCVILTREQASTLDLNPPRRRSAQDGVEPGCRWIHSPYEPVEAYFIAVNAERGIEDVFGNSRGATSIEVAGFPAVETQSEDLMFLDTQCIIVVDVAGGKSIQINYDYNGDTLPMTRELACQRARPVAEFAMQTIIGLNNG